jgi:hypothetical protein
MEKPFLLSGPNGATYDYDNIVGLAKLRGKATGVRAAKERLIQHAADLFLAGDDEKAAIIRDLAKDVFTGLTDQCDHEANKYKQEHHAKVVNDG